MPIRYNEEQLLDSSVKLKTSQNHSCVMVRFLTILINFICFSGNKISDYDLKMIFYFVFCIPFHYCKEKLLDPPYFGEKQTISHGLMDFNY